MTGFGKASQETASFRITVEIKSLNSKNLDLNIRPGGILGEREMGLRTQVAESLNRGKIDLSINLEKKAPTLAGKLNYELASAYLSGLRSFCEKENLRADGEILRLAFGLPGSVKPDADAFGEEDWEALNMALQAAISQLQAFRDQEGLHMKTEILARIARIREIASGVNSCLPERSLKIRQKINQALQENLSGNPLNENRLEQEMIFYMERLDVNEELVRLGNHLDYFDLVAGQPEHPGRKLAFVVQEIGREINTLGSKANHSGIQKMVVDMKDELEKIRELLLNVL